MSVVSSDSARRTVLVLGQTPPPWHGQAVLIDQLVHTQADDVRLIHVRMAFSRTQQEIGRMQPRKLLQLASVLARAVVARYRHGASILYYPPAGGSLAPVLRDLVLLSLLRPLFAKTVFHFHAAGLAAFQAQLPALLLPLFHRAYRHVDLAIVSSEHVTEDAQQLAAKAIAVIAPSLPDEFPNYAQAVAQARDASPRAYTRILYVGALSESKGVLQLVDAIAALRAEQLPVHLDLVGACDSSAFERALADRIARHALTSHVTCHGVLTGPRKWQMYAGSDMHCFPSQYDAETFGLAVLEAMQLELPVVATRFRSLPAIVVHGETGLLVPTNDPGALAAALAELCRDPARRRALGRKGRQRYLELFSQDRCARGIMSALASM